MFYCQHQNHNIAECRHRSKIGLNIISKHVVKQYRLFQDILRRLEDSVFKWISLCKKNHLIIVIGGFDEA